MNLKPHSFKIVPYLVPLFRKLLINNLLPSPLYSTQRESDFPVRFFYNLPRPATSIRGLFKRIHVYLR